MAIAMGGGGGGGVAMNIINYVCGDKTDYSEMENRIIFSGAIFLLLTGEDFGFGQLQCGRFFIICKPVQLSLTVS